MSFLPSVKPRDVIRIALKLEFVFDRQSGSHAIYYREKDKKRIVVPMHPKEIKKKALYGIIKDMGIDVEEFKKLL